MERHYPKFEQRQRRNTAEQQMAQTQGREGIVISYNSFDNTATVMMTLPKSEMIGPIHKKVPCPTFNGVQMMAPEPGRMCWVMFEGNNERKPFITHFYNHEYSQFDYPKMQKANSMIPRFYGSM